MPRTPFGPRDGNVRVEYIGSRSVVTYHRSCGLRGYQPQGQVRYATIPTISMSVCTGKRMSGEDTYQTSKQFDFLRDSESLQRLLHVKRSVSHDELVV